MTITATANPDNPPEISWKHKLPIWSIPQLSFLKKRLGIIVTNVTFDYPADFNRRTDSMVVRVYLPTDRAYYLFRIYKSDMNSPNQVPPMYEVL